MAKPDPEILVPPNLIAAYTQALIACKEALPLLKGCQCTDPDLLQGPILEIEHALDMAKEG